MIVDPDQVARIAVVNFYVKGNQTLDRHLDRINVIAEQAKKKSAAYLLLPELIALDLFSENPPDKDVHQTLETLGSQFSSYEDGLKKIAIHHKLNIIGASMVRTENSNFINRAFFVSSDGVVKYQDKLRPTPWEKKYGFTGGKALKTFQTKDFSFAILICHDAEFPGISAELINSKPEVIFVPSQTDNRYGLNRVKYTSSARAIEHMAYVLMTGTSGNTEAPWHSYVGQNFFFTPQNQYFPEGFQHGEFNKENVSLFTLDLKKLRLSRADTKQIYPARDASK